MGRSCPEQVGSTCALCKLESESLSEQAALKDWPRARWVKPAVNPQLLVTYRKLCRKSPTSVSPASFLRARAPSRSPVKPTLARWRPKLSRTGDQRPWRRGKLKPWGCTMALKPR